MSAPNPFEVMDDDDRRAALAVRCPHSTCRARPYSACTTPSPRNRPLSGNRMHPSRYEAGRAARPAAPVGWF